MKNKVFTFLYLFILLAVVCCTNEKQKTFIKSGDEDMQQFIERIIPQFNAEISYDILEWQEWKMNDVNTSNFLILKNLTTNMLEFKVLFKKDEKTYELHEIIPIEDAAFTKYTNVTWSFPYIEAIDLNNDNMQEFVLVTNASGLVEVEDGMVPVNDKMMLCFEYKNNQFIEVDEFNEIIMQLPAVNLIFNQPELTMAGQGTLTGTDEILAFLQEINFMEDGSGNMEFVSIINQEEFFAYDKCVVDRTRRAFKNESKISDSAYWPIYVESGNKTTEYTIQSVEELSENYFELSIIAVRDLQQQIFDTQIKMHIFWNQVWILEKEDFYYTTRENAKQLKQIERDCPEV